MLFGASQAVTSMVLLLKNRQKPFASYLLALLTLSWGFSCYWFFAFIHGAPYFSRAITSFIGPMVSLTLFPPLFLYVKYLFFEYDSFRRKDHLHFLPVYVYLAFTLYLFLSQGATIDGLRSHPWYSSRSMASSLVAMVQGPFYFFKANRLLNLWQQKLKDEYSDIENKKLEWLRIINSLFVPVFLIGGVSTIIKSAHVNAYLLYMAYHGVMAWSLFHITLSIVRHPYLFTLPVRPVEVKYTPMLSHRPSGFKAPITAPQVSKKGEDVLKRLQKVMEEKKLFKNPAISLSDLARETGESRNSVSAALNNHLQKNFYDYINALRIEESKRLLSNERLEHFTIEAIASEAGFGSVSVFYRLFKTQEKMTPAEFRKIFLQR